MAKEKEVFEWIRAIVDCGSLRWQYKVNTSDVVGGDAHDEDISDWTDDDIKDMTCSMLGVKDDQRDLIEIQYR